MTDFLIKKFVKNYDDVKNVKVRESYGTLSGFTGIFVNILLCLIKFAVGFFTKSLSVTADAVNNLSDASSSIVGILGAKMSAKPADKEHPFGHGRSEYISAFIVASIILFMGFELFKSSLSKIFSPQPVVFSYVSLIVLLISIPFKLFLAVFNNKLAKRTGSLTIKAVVKDSIFDMVATLCVIVGLAVSGLTRYNVDGYLGLIVALLILKAGLDTANEVFTALIGTVPDKKLIENIKKTVLAHDGVVGIHDMMVHDYGPNKIICSLHAEVPASCDILISHDLIDNIEFEINEKFGVLTTIHLDPIETENETVLKLKETTGNIVKSVDTQFSIHDFRVVTGTTHTNLLFDIVVPFGCKMKDNEILEQVNLKIKEINSSYNVVAKIENDFI